MTECVAKPLAMSVLAIGADAGVKTRLAESLDGAAVALHSVVLAGRHYLPEETPAEFTRVSKGLRLHLWSPMLGGTLD
jgi:hypothetical protein